MNALYKMKEMLMDELEKCSKKGELSAGSLDVVDKLTHSIKSIDTIIAMDEAGYSNDSGYRYDSRGDYGYTNAGRRGNVRRDSMGRYSRDDAMHDLKKSLHELMDDAKDEESRRMVEEWIRQVDRR